MIAEKLSQAYPESTYTYTATSKPSGSGPVPTVRILGTRGLPAKHGGFETFAQNFAFHLRDRGWSVVIYCQEEGDGPIREDVWKGIRRVIIPVSGKGACSTLKFDWKATRHASNHRDLCLTLGYNTAIFTALLRLRGIRNVINMDGIEWSRAKWPLPARIWLFLNEVAGCWLADHLVADHPCIADHLAKRTWRKKITTIPYGSPKVEEANPAILTSLGLEPDRYAILIARPEPENSIAEIVEAWSNRHRGMKLVVLGKYQDSVRYQREVRRTASKEVLFPGPIYNKGMVQSLRLHARFYVHGHQVGGTNPSLVESLGCGNAVLAHDNRFNRWVAGTAAVYFTDVVSCEAALESLISDDALVRELHLAARDRHVGTFTFDAVHRAYEDLLSRHLATSTESATIVIRS